MHAYGIRHPGVIFSMAALREDVKRAINRTRIEGVSFVAAFQT